MINNTLTPIIVLALGPFALASADVNIMTAQGDVSLPSSPEKVVSYSVASADTLNALGISLAGGPENIFLPWLEALDVPDAGTLHEPDLEKLAGIDPDLVIVGERTSTQLASVSRVATSIDMTIGQDLVADARARIVTYGDLFDRKEAAAELITTLDEKFDALRQAAMGKGTALIVLTSGPKMSAYGRGSRFGWIHRATGLEPAIGELDTEATHGNAISHELIAEANPDWLFVLDRGAAIGADGQNAEQTLSSSLVESTNAWKNDQVVYLPPGELYIGGGGYQALSNVVDALTDALAQP